MGIHDSGIHHCLDTPSTYRTPTMGCLIHTPSFCTPIAGRPSTTTASTTTTTAAAAAAATTTITTETDADAPDLSCQRRPRTFIPRIVLVGHLRIHLTETGAPKPTHRIRL
nr:unnamed protein product [Spirometra erinaceieuropaei]